MNMNCKGKYCIVSMIAGLMYLNSGVEGITFGGECFHSIGLVANKDDFKDGNLF